MIDATVPVQPQASSLAMSAVLDVGKTYLFMIAPGWIIGAKCEAVMTDVLGTYVVMGDPIYFESVPVCAFEIAAAKTADALKKSVTNYHMVGKRSCVQAACILFTVECNTDLQALRAAKAGKAIQSAAQ